MKTFPIPTPIRRLVLTVGLALTLLILALTASTQAAPAAQTVPPPTAVPANTPVPTVTPFDRDGDDGNRDDDNRNDDGGNNDSDDSRGDSGQNQQGNEPPAAPTAPAPAPAPEAVTTVAFPGRITGAGLNVRLGPGTDYDVAGTLTRGDEFDILGRNVENTWWLICCLPETEMRGWVSANFVETEFSRSAALTQLPVQPDDVALSDETVGAVEISESVSPTATQPTTQTTQSSTQAVTQAVTAAAAPASEELNETGLALLRSLRFALCDAGAKRARSLHHYQRGRRGSCRAAVAQRAAQHAHHRCRSLQQQR